MTDEQATIRAVVAGDRDGFRLLVQRYERPVFCLLHNLLPDRQLCEDVAQETFLAAYRNLGSYDPAILERDEIVALSKVDLLADADEILAPIEDFFHNQGVTVFRISSATKLGIRELIAGMARALDAVDAALAEEEQTS